MNAGLSTLGFYHQIENCYVVNKDIPNFAVAYPETNIYSLLNKYGLEAKINHITVYGAVDMNIQVIKILLLQKRV